MLPMYLRTIREFDEFKRNFTGFILFLLDKSPVPGYSGAGNHKSLVEVVLHRQGELEK